MPNHFQVYSTHRKLYVIFWVIWMKKVWELKLRSISEIWHWSITSQHSDPNGNIFGTNCQRQLVRVKDFWRCNRQYYQIWDNPRIRIKKYKWDLALVNNIQALRPKQENIWNKLSKTTCAGQRFWRCNRQYYQIWDNPRIKIIYYCME